MVSIVTIQYYILVSRAMFTVGYYVLGYQSSAQLKYHKQMWDVKPNLHYLFGLPIHLLFIITNMLKCRMCIPFSLNAEVVCSQMFLIEIKSLLRCFHHRNPWALLSFGWLHFVLVGTVFVYILCTETFSLLIVNNKINKSIYKAPGICCINLCSKYEANFVQKHPNSYGLILEWYIVDFYRINYILQ